MARHRCGSVSVVIPVYNGEKYVGAAIDSVLSQTLVPDEVIVVDDGSTDKTPRIVQSFADVRYLRQENQGPGPATNAGVVLSRCENLAFLDADDLWVTDKLERQVEWLDRDPTLEAVFGMLEEFVSPDLHLRERQRFSARPGSIDASVKGTMLIRKGAFQRVGPLSDRWIGGDFVDWYARAQDKELRTACLNRVVLRRRIHGENLSIQRDGFPLEIAQILRETLRRRAERP